MKVTLLRALMEIRSDARRGRLGIYLGEPDVRRLEGFVMGFLVCQDMAGAGEDSYLQFKDWLRATKSNGIDPGISWPQWFVEHAGGDQERGIHAFLDAVAEFVDRHPSVA